MRLYPYLRAERLPELGYVGFWESHFYQLIFASKYPEFEIDEYLLNFGLIMITISSDYMTGHDSMYVVVSKRKLLKCGHEISSVEAVSIPDDLAKSSVSFIEFLASTVKLSHNRNHDSYI